MFRKILPILFLVVIVLFFFILPKKGEEKFPGWETCFGAACTLAQHEALQDLMYNVGRGNIIKSTLVKRLKKGECKGKASSSQQSCICKIFKDEMPKFHFAGGKHAQYLSERRTRALKWAACL